MTRRTATPTRTTTTRRKRSVEGGWRLIVLHLVLWCCGCLVSVAGQRPPVVVDEWLTKMLKVTTELSAESFSDDPQVTVQGISNLRLWTDGPNQAVTARYEGRCFIAFRGLGDLIIGDIIQVADFRLATVCQGEIQEAGFRRLQNGQCCEFRAGWVDSFDASYLEASTQELRECRRQCANQDDCLYIAGHSAGAATAPVAATYYQNWNPYIFSYGEPPSVVEPCRAINTDRYYRIVNTQTGNQGEIQYDYVSMTPRYRGTTIMGNLIVMSADLQGLAFVGTNVRTILTPLCIDCHRMRTLPGILVDTYRIRIDEIFRLSTSRGYNVVRTDGFRDGFPCSLDVECRSERCRSGRCLPKLPTCTTCSQSSDCRSGNCQWFIFGCGSLFTLFEFRCG